ncbi:MAG: RnfH family protein [Betaproteobacteria bacterium]|nr:RnfH family protein [Betaproteobacteria bacterium]
MSGLRVEVVYATPELQDVAALELPAGATAMAAIRASGMLGRHPEIDLARQKIGVFGKPVDANTALRDGDRVEIYRALRVDPRAVRRARALRR